MTNPERDPRRIVLIGNPNVGKSVIFRLLTGSYVLVSNFPGTTVEISRGRLQVGGKTYEVVDTPGVYSLAPQSEDERVTCEILLREKPDLVIQVADAKNLRRTLLITSQLAEFGLPLVLVMNMMDEAEERGIEIDMRSLSELFGVPVVGTVAIYSQGRKRILHAIQNAARPKNPLKIGSTARLALDQAGVPGHLPAALASEWVEQGDAGFLAEVDRSFGEGTVARLRNARESHHRSQRRSLARGIAEDRGALLDEAATRLKRRRETRFVDESATAARVWLGALAAGVVIFLWNELGSLFHVVTPIAWITGAANSIAGRMIGASSPSATLLQSLFIGEVSGSRYGYGLIPELVHFCLMIAPLIFPLYFLLGRDRNFTHELGVLTRHPSTGLPILALVLLLMFEFVGYTGAQTLVGLLEKVVFGRYLVPLLRELIPAGLIHEFIAGKYGLVSMGLTYAIAIVLPVVATFFIAFGLLEDSGYLPRLSILTDRVMRVMGLNGKATLPMVLGLGCCTMATMTTRILNSKKERLIATLLLALGIPCSAQLGVILGIAAGFSAMATVTVIGVVVSQLLLVGYLASKLVSGRPSEFIFEIPPIRRPQMRNVFLKTGHRVLWYLKEAVPLFLVGTLALFILDWLRIGGRSLLEWVQVGLAPVLMGVLHLPAEAASVFVLGFLRRDYGAAGLFSLARAGRLDGQQVVVSLIVITLFVPCVASFLVIVKEQGLKKAMAITAFIVPFAISVGGVVSWFLRTFSINFH